MVIIKNKNDQLNRKEYVPGPELPPTPWKHCNVKGCNNNKRSRGFCEKHYSRWKLYGDPEMTATRRYEIGQKCKIEGCEREVDSNEMCKKHYGQEQNKRPEVRKRKAELFKKRYDNEEDFRKKRLNNYKRWAKLNPRKAPQDTIELFMAKLNVRIRDNSTCQWYGCGKTRNEDVIHVHHIFPRSEYPELELVEDYMICYCTYHHGLFHYYRGDKTGQLIQSQGITNKELKECDNCHELLVECVCNEHLDGYINEQEERNE